MKRSILEMILSLVCLIAAGGTAAVAADVYVSGLVPNWDQPYDYPDAFDATGPGAGPGMWNAWCTPTAAAMMMGHWADVKGVPTTGDASKDGNQAAPNVYGGVAYALGPSWHDYTADGTNGRPAPGPYPPGGVPSETGAFAPAAAVLTDIGWYMNTNNLGANNLGVNPGMAHVGTYEGNCAEGLNDFLSARGSPLAGNASTTFVTGLTPVPALVATIKSEIDANRTVLGHFLWWVNPATGPAGPGEGNSANTQESQFETATPSGFGHYNFYTSNPGTGPHGASWNGTSGSEGLGHTVTIVGYTKDANGNVTDLICHDDWPTTVRDVQVTVLMAGGPNGFFPLDAITTLVPEPGTWALLVGAALAMLGWKALRRRR
jgi:hypothetical protein